MCVRYSVISIVELKNYKQSHHAHRFIARQTLPKACRVGDLAAAVRAATVARRYTELCKQREVV